MEGFVRNRLCFLEQGGSAPHYWMLFGVGPTLFLNGGAVSGGIVYARHTPSVPNYWVIVVNPAGARVEPIEFTMDPTLAPARNGVNLFPAGF